MTLSKNNFQTEKRKSCVQFNPERYSVISDKTRTKNNAAENGQNKSDATREE